MDTAYDRLPLNALRVFEAVATRLNFAEAAEALHVTPAAVSQQIRTLEDYLQTPLFRRSGRRVELTAEGADLLPRVRRGLDELESALQHVKRSREGGTLNVSMLSSFLQKWFAPRLGDLQLQLPQIELRIHSGRTPVDFARSDFHAAIRLGTGPYADLYSVRLLEEWLVPVATPALVAAHGLLHLDAELSRYPLLHGTDEPWSEFLSADSRKKIGPPPARIDDSVSIVSAALEGLGYALGRWSLVARDVAAGRLAVAGTFSRRFRSGYHFVCPESYVAMPKVAQFRDWLVVQGAAHAPPPGLEESQPGTRARR